jgi:hypothetical protein
MPQFGLGNVGPLHPLRYLIRNTGQNRYYFSQKATKTSYKQLKSSGKRPRLGKLPLFIKLYLPVHPRIIHFSDTGTFGLSDTVLIEEGDQRSEARRGAFLVTNGLQKCQHLNIAHVFA